MEHVLDFVAEFVAVAKEVVFVTNYAYLELEVESLSHDPEEVHWVHWVH